MSAYRKVRKDGSSYWCYDIYFEGQRYRGYGGNTKTLATRAGEKLRSNLMSGEFDLETPQKITKIERFAETYLERNLHLRSYKRVDLSVRTLLKFFKGRTLRSISVDDIQNYISKRRREGVANGTINRELACLKSMLYEAIKSKEVRSNPVKQVKFLPEPPGRTRMLDLDEAQRLIDAADPHMKPVIITALNTGLRLREILTLKWNQVHIASTFDPFIEVDRTKNNKRRAVPLNDDMIELLEGIEKRGDGYVFHGVHGRPITVIKEPWQRALLKAGIVDFRFHDLRHTFASHFVMNGGDILTLKEILGHSSMKMVDRYAHRPTAYKRQQINKLSGHFHQCHHNATATKMVAINDQ